MNIFILDTNPVLAASYHCDKHIVKMVLETAQILSTIIGLNGGDTFEGIYKPTHKNHPCTLWVAKSSANYEWTCRLGIELSKEYTRRYNKTHKSAAVIKKCLKAINSIDFDLDIYTPAALAMPDQYKTSSTVESYRNYYIGEKSPIAQWKYSETPSWFKTV